MPNTNFRIRELVAELSFGIEIECLLSADQYIKMYDYHGFWFATGDGSINCDWEHNGVEFVSQPLPRLWLKKEVDKLYKKWNIAYNRSCGIHIHVNKRSLTSRKIKRIKEFINSLTPYERVRFFGRNSNFYCNYDGADGDSRYVPVNCLNKETVEFRMFRSGDVKWAKYCIEVVYYLITRSKALSIDGLFAVRHLHYGDSLEVSDD